MSTTKDHSLNTLRAQVMQLVSSPEAAALLVKALDQTDWQTYFQQVQASRERERVATKALYESAGLRVPACDRCGKEAFVGALVGSCWPHLYPGRYCTLCVDLLNQEGRRSPTSCRRCRRVFPFHELQDLNDVPGSHFLHCPSCAEAIRNDYRRQCCLCQSSFFAPMRTNQIALCSSCRTEKRLREYRRVVEHNERAQAARLPATLSLQEWLASLEHFSWTCAYCGGEFETIEHYLSISRGGSTSAKNCLPACHTCNFKKGNRPPETLEHLFGAERLLSIRTYLATP